MRQQKTIFSNIDTTMLVLYLLLVVIGWINIYAAVYNDKFSSIFDVSQAYGKQMMWIAGAFVIAFMILIIDGKFYSTFSNGFYISILFLLILVLLLGKETHGSSSWFKIGNFRFQPSEFAKFATALAVSKYLSAANINIQDLKTKLITIALITVPTLLILIQNDTGSAIVFIAFVFVLYREGLSGNVLIIGFIMIFLFFLTLLIDKFVIIGTLISAAILMFFFIRKKFKEIFLLIVVFLSVSAFVFSIDYIYNSILEPHQKQRIDVLLGNTSDLKGIGYNINQSKIAIGSGGFLGKGFLQGTQTKYNFVPEQSTDFIFCTIGEEWGLIGSLTTIGLFILLLLRILYIAERQRSSFSRIYGYCVASIIFIHFAVNIGMTVGLMPVIGIPLPFISYGGSSLWSFTILLFIFIKLDAYRVQIL